MSSKQYCEILSGVVSLPAWCECSLMDFARRIKVQIVFESGKLNPDNALINLLCDAAKIGYEYGECAQGNKELAKQHLTQQDSKPLEISVDVICKVIGERYSGKVAVELIEIMQQQQKLLPC